MKAFDPGDVPTCRDLGAGHVHTSTAAQLQVKKARSVLTFKSPQPDVRDQPKKREVKRTFPARRRRSESDNRQALAASTLPQ